MLYYANCNDENCQTPADDYPPDRCKACKSGFYLTYDERYCEECDEQQGKILILNYNLAHNGQVKKCYTKVDNCQKYSESDDFCELCKDGFKRDENGKCVQCGANEIGMNNYCFKKIERCIEYNLYKEGEKCDYCGDNYEFNGSCVKCPNGYILDELGIMCQKECPLGKKLSYGECIDEIDNCDTYAQSKKCSKCYGYHELKEDGTCSSCGFEKVGNGLKCFDRIEGCSEQNGGICERCANSDEVLNEERNQCIQKEIIENCMIQINDKCSICNGGYKPNTDQKSCEQCESGKDEDIESCLFANCIAGGVSHTEYKKPVFECNACASSDFYLTTSKQQCNLCGKGKYNLNGQCIDEIKNCAKYKSDKSCEECASNYQLKNGECLPCVNPYIGNGKTCYLPSFRCVLDDDYGNCFKCFAGYYLNSEKVCIRDGIEGSSEGTSNSFGLNLNIILLILYGLLI